MSIIERLDGVAGAFDPAKPLDRADIAVVMIENAIAVEKSGGTPPIDNVAARALQTENRRLINHSAVAVRALRKWRQCSMVQSIVGRAVFAKYRRRAPILTIAFAFSHGRQTVAVIHRYGIRVSGNGNAR